MQTEQEMDEEYENKKKELEERFLEKLNKGVEREKAEEWLRKNLRKVRQEYYQKAETSIAFAGIKQKLFKHLGPLINLLRKIRQQFE